jgi:hypothetical protein
MSMATTSKKLAFVVGLVGAFALAATAASAAPKAKPVKDSYEAWGLTNKDGVPPVPGAAMSSYKPGMCWRTFPGQDHHIGVYITCTECKKLSQALCHH